MPRVDSQDPLLPSLIDRLIDDQPDVSTEPEWQRSQNLREYEHAVLRDVEALLNTRQTRPDLSADFHEAARSVLTYGLPDITAAGAASADDFELLRLAVELAIARFEPRLREVRVKIGEPDHKNSRSLRMVIEGLLWVQPDPQPIAFDTIVEADSGQCTIRPS